MTNAKKFAFRVDWVRPVTVIVLANNATDARTDAVSAIHAEFGGTARIVGSAETIRRLPDDAFQIKKCKSNGEHWAWAVVRK